MLIQQPGKYRMRNGKTAHITNITRGQFAYGSHAENPHTSWRKKDGRFYHQVESEFDIVEKIPC